MRHVRIRGKAPDAQWLAQANRLLADLRAANTKAARDAIIDDNANVWKSLKPWLLELSSQKCWFSEAKDCFSHWDVEHYRPKKYAKDADGTTHDGYWWLSFDWRNLRICGNAGNRMKGTYFPLRTGCTRIGPSGDVRHEDPQLLDPADPDDPGLLSFNVEGRAIPAAHLTDAWERERVTYTVERCNLDFGPLADKRKVVWAECWNRITEYLEELTTYHKDKTNVIARDRYRRAMEQIREMVKDDKELSAVARACVLGSGDPRVVNLLQST